MILDEQSLFSNNQAVTESCVSENILDLGNREVSFGTPVPLCVMVTETFDNLTSLTIEVQTSADEEFTTPVTLSGQTVLADDLVKGEVLNINFLPKGNLGFVRLSYTVTGTAPANGKILAGIVDSKEESYHSI